MLITKIKISYNTLFIQKHFCVYKAIFSYFDQTAAQFRVASVIVAPTPENRGSKCNNEAEQPRDRLCYVAK